MKLFKAKCFLVALDYAQYIHSYIIWMKAMLGNKSNNFCLDTLCFLRNISLIEAALFD